jgi:hypothetical protein
MSVFVHNNSSLQVSISQVIGRKGNELAKQSAMFIVLLMEISSGEGVTVGLTVLKRDA